MKENTCCFTGHREIEAADADTLPVRLRDTICELIACGYTHFVAGGALGFDTLAAEAVLSLKTEYPSLRLILMLPCQNQTARWGAQDIRRYETIRSAADECIYISDHYFRGCMHRRNRAMVDASSVCISYLRKPSGGTAYTVDYARIHGVTVRAL